MNGTTCSGGAQGASTCIPAGSQCSWYSFVATASEMYVQIDYTSSGGCFFSSNVYSSTSACGGLAQIACQSGTPLDDFYSFTTLVPGNTYYVQVCYAPGGPCGGAGTSGYADYCISVGEPDPPCAVCSAPCGTASGYTAVPSAATVVADCNTSLFSPALAAGSTNTYCYSFQATATFVDFNVIITSNCSGGNVTGFSWSLYDAACGSAIQTGTLASLTFTGLTVGSNYVFCYTFTVPAGCTHSQHCPYFVGATVLPVTLVDFTAHYNGRYVELNWMTVSELNSDYFVVERSADGLDFVPVNTIDAAGNSNVNLSYEINDFEPVNGVTYYRIKQVDSNGEFVYTEVRSVQIENKYDQLTLFPNPANDKITVTFYASEKEDFSLQLVDATGRLVYVNSITSNAGMNAVDLDLTLINRGVYFVSITNKNETLQSKFIKE